MITRLTTQWQERARRSPSAAWPRSDYVYVWADGIHFNVRLDENRLCCW